MKIEHQQVGSVDVLKPLGALVEDDTEQFGRALMARLRVPNPRLVVAMAEVAYMDSAALELLLDGADEAVDRAVSLKLACVPPTCREILELTGLTERFQLFEDVEDAVRSYL